MIDQWRARIVCRAVTGLVALAFTGTAWHAEATTFTVNSAADTTDGAYGPAVGECTLREAIENAVATAGRDTIAFDPGVFPRTPLNVIGLTNPLPVIEDAAGTVVDGAGAGVSISGGAGVSEGLVFTSPPGVPLVKVTVANPKVGISLTATLIATATRGKRTSLGPSTIHASSSVTL